MRLIWMGPRVQKMVLAKRRSIKKWEAEKKQSKYHNAKDKRGELTFDSKDELGDVIATAPTIIEAEVDDGRLH